MNLEEAQRIARRHEDTYNNDFERYGDLYAADCVIYRPAQGVTHDKPTMLALERRATAACPDRKSTVLARRWIHSAHFTASDGQALEIARLMTAMCLAVVTNDADRATNEPV